MKSEFKDKYKVNIEHSEISSYSNEELQNLLKIKNINIRKVLERYREGMHITHIKTLFSLTEEEMNFIIKKYVLGTNIEGLRKRNIEKFKQLPINILPKEELEDYKPPKNRFQAYKNLQEAIKRVEGEGR